MLLVSGSESIVVGIEFLLLEVLNFQEVVKFIIIFISLNLSPSQVFCLVSSNQIVENTSEFGAHGLNEFISLSVQSFGLPVHLLIVKLSVFVRALILLLILITQCILWLLIVIILLWHGRIIFIFVSDVFIFIVAITCPIEVITLIELHLLHSKCLLSALLLLDSSCDLLLDFEVLFLFSLPFLFNPFKPFTLKSLFLLASLLSFSGEALLLNLVIDPCKMSDICLKAPILDRFQIEFLSLLLFLLTSSSKFLRSSLSEDSPGLLLLPLLFSPPFSFEALSLFFLPLDSLLFKTFGFEPFLL